MFSEAVYRWLGGCSICLLAIAMGLTGYILTGRHSRKRVYIVCGSVLFLLLSVTVSCMIIYAEYHTPIPLK